MSYDHQYLLKLEEKTLTQKHKNKKPTRHYVFHKMQLEELCPWISGAKYLYIYIHNIYIYIYKLYIQIYMIRLNIQRMQLTKSREIPQDKQPVFSQQINVFHNNS